MGRRIPAWSSMRDTRRLWEQEILICVSHDETACVEGRRISLFTYKMSLRNKLFACAAVALLSLAALLASKVQPPPPTSPKAASSQPGSDATTVVSAQLPRATTPLTVTVAAVDPSKVPGRVVPGHFPTVTAVHEVAPPTEIPPPGAPRTPLVQQPVTLSTGEVLQGAALDETWRVPVFPAPAAR